MTIQFSPTRSQLGLVVGTLLLSALPNASGAQTADEQGRADGVLIEVQTEVTTPFRPNLRVGDVGHSLIIGPTGSSGPAWARRLRTEQRLQYAGVLTGGKRFTGLFTIVYSPPRDAETLRANPLGLYTHSLNWGEDVVAGDTK